MTEPKKRKIVQSDAREIIARVYHYLKKEVEVTVARNPINCDFSHLRNIRQRTADATGSSVRTVTRILREQRALAEQGQPEKVPSPRRPDWPPEVVSTIQDYINTNNEPDLKELKSILSEKISYNCTLTKLRKIVLDLGYELDNTLSKIVMTSWIFLKEEHVSDQEDDLDVKPQFDWSVRDTCDPGEPGSTDSAEEVLIVHIKSEPETDEVVEIVQVKQEPDSSS